MLHSPHRTPHPCQEELASLLGGGPGDGADAPARGAPVGKAFTFVGSDLPRRFPHTFAAFPGCDFSAPVPHTLLRLPLRAAAKAPSPLGRPECPPEAARALLRALAADGGERALLFAASLQRLRVSEWAPDAVAPAAEPLLPVPVAEIPAAPDPLVPWSVPDADTPVPWVPPEAAAPAVEIFPVPEITPERVWSFVPE